MPIPEQEPKQKFTSVAQLDSWPTAEQIRDVWAKMEDPIERAKRVNREFPRMSPGKASGKRYR